MPNNNEPPALNLFFHLAEIIQVICRDIAWLWRKSRAAAEKRTARAEALAAEAQQRARAQQRYELVRQQMARRNAGFASPEEARAALGGRGGRPNKLDDRRF